MATDNTTKATDHQLPPSPNRQDILWRDFVFVILAGIGLRIVSYVELHAADADRGFSKVSTETPSSPTQIVDAGFVLTYPLYDILHKNPALNDALAAINSLVLVIPSIYIAYITLWFGDYTLSFRLLATQLFRSFCGWFTYLPPDPTFLMSIYDFPEIFQCLLSDCVTEKPDVLPFVSFFSGHVATVVITANHMFTRNYIRSAVALHIFNIFQILRLLATRGHYSIDIIIGWAVAIYVSNPAAKLGLYYSRGVNLRELAFETVMGVTDFVNHEDELFQTETTAKIAAQMAKDLATSTMSELRKEVELREIQIQEIHDLRRDDLIKLLSWAHLKVEELKAEARLLGVNLPSEFIHDKQKIIEFMWQRAKFILGETGVNWFTSESNEELEQKKISFMNSACSEYIMKIPVKKNTKG